MYCNPKGGWSRSLLPGNSDETSTDDLKLCQERLCLRIRNDFLSREQSALAQVAQGGLESSSIQGIRNHGDVAPRAAVIGHSGAALGRGILEVLSNLSDSMILCKKGNVGCPFVVVWLGSSFVLPMEAFQIRAGF